MKEENIEGLFCDFGQYEALWGSHRIGCKIIIRVTGRYIVYIDHKNNIDWETTEIYDSSKPADKKSDYERVLSLCLISEHKPTDGLSEASLLSFKTIIGEAIVNCLEGDCEGALEILKQADDFRIDRVVEKSREWYLSYTVTTSAALIAIALVMNSLDTYMDERILQHFNVGAWAVAGACLSIILRSGRLHHASYAGQQLHFMESGCRLVGGFISGQIVYLGIMSGILFSAFAEGAKSAEMISLFSLLAGASERFAPSIITKVEESASIGDSSKEISK